MNATKPRSRIEFYRRVEQRLLKGWAQGVLVHPCGGETVYVPASSRAAVEDWAKDWNGRRTHAKAVVRPIELPNLAERSPDSS